jgi:hypothetical protein
MNAPSRRYRPPASPRHARARLPVGLEQLELQLWHVDLPALGSPPVVAAAPQLARLACPVDHQPGEPRRLAGKASAVVRCTRCSCVLERLGVVDLVDVGLELAALPLDRRAA